MLITMRFSAARSTCGGIPISNSCSTKPHYIWFDCELSSSSESEWGSLYYPLLDSLQSLRCSGCKFTLHSSSSFTVACFLCFFCLFGTVFTLFKTRRATLCSLMLLQFKHFRNTFTLIFFPFRSPCVHLAYTRAVAVALCLIPRWLA